jgi:hypothetical protein
MASSSEQSTAILGQSPDAATTKRLDPRPTSPGNELNSQLLPAVTVPPSPASSWSKLIAIGLVAVVLVMVAVGVMWSRRAGDPKPASLLINRSLMYPGSRTVMDMGDTGGAVLQLETPDELDKVVAWYDASLKPTKTMRIGTTSIIQRRDTVTVTLVSEDNHTSIVVKEGR